VDAGVIRLPSPEGSSSEPILATIGMSTEEAARQPVAGPPGGQPARAVRIAYAYTHDESREDGDLIHGGLSIPLREDGEGEPIADAEQLYRRVQFAVGARPIGPFERLHLSAGIAQLRSDDDATSFFERADEALYQAKEAGKGQFMATDGLV
jgi:hypothetical protein